MLSKLRYLPMAFRATRYIKCSRRAKALIRAFKNSIS